MTCRDAIAVLADFLDDALDPHAVARLEAHLSDCEACRAYLATYRRTRGLVAQAGRVGMPAELRARLRQFLLDELAG
jgi:anti-sigma factor (TIGR02949 family)